MVGYDSGNRFVSAIIYTQQLVQSTDTHKKGTRQLIRKLIVTCVDEHLSKRMSLHGEIEVSFCHIINTRKEVFKERHKTPQKSGGNLERTPKNTPERGRTEELETTTTTEASVLIRVRAPAFAATFGMMVGTSTSTTAHALGRSRA